MSFKPSEPLLGLLCTVAAQNGAQADELKELVNYELTNAVLGIFQSIAMSCQYVGNTEPIVVCEGGAFTNEAAEAFIKRVQLPWDVQAFFLRQLLDDLSAALPMQSDDWCLVGNHTRMELQVTPRAPPAPSDRVRAVVSTFSRNAPKKT